MIILGAVFAALAALVHVYIFVLESIRWTHPATRRVFGTSEEQAQTTKQLAFNQGFYNLFLAVIAGLGVVLVGSQRTVGLTLMLVATGSMLAAALVLVLSDRSKARAAVVQGLAPLVAVVALGLAAATG
jgi:putative membrane protein